MKTAQIHTTKRRTPTPVRRWLALGVTLGGVLLCGMAQPETRETAAPESPSALVAAIGAEPWPAVGAIDADTIEVLLNGRRVEIDLRGLETPSELDRGETPAFAPEAVFFVHNFVAGERLRFAGIVVGTDGRASAYAQRLPDGLDLNGELVRQGFARADADQRHPRSSEFLELQDRAALLQKGLWGERRVVRANGPGTRSNTGSGGRSGGAGGGAGVGPEGTGVATPAVESPRAAEPGRPDAAAGVTVFVTRTGTKYHRASCRYARSGSAREIALSAVGDRTPCSVCHPPRPGG